MDEETRKTENDNNAPKTNEISTIKDTNADCSALNISGNNIKDSVFYFFESIFSFKCIINFFKSPKESQDKQDTNNTPTIQSKTSKKICGKIIEYNRKSKKGIILSKKIEYSFSGDDVLDNRYIIKNAKVTFTGIEDGKNHRAENIEIHRILAKVKSYNENKKEGFLSIKNIDDDLKVDVQKDVKNDYRLIVGSTVTCNVIIDENGKLHVKNVFTKRFVSHAPIYALLLGSVLFLILTFLLTSSDSPLYIEQISKEWTMLILVALIANIIILILYPLDKIWSLDSNDKKKDEFNTKPEKPRFPEAWLHFFEFLGVLALFSIVAQRIFSHKTREDQGYQNTFWLLVLSQVLIFLISGLLYLIGKIPFLLTFYALFGTCLLIIIIVNFAAYWGKRIKEYLSKND